MYSISGSQQAINEIQENDETPRYKYQIHGKKNMQKAGHSNQ